MTANIVTREISQKNHANKVLKEVENLQIEDLNYKFI